MSVCVTEVDMNGDEDEEEEEEDEDDDDSCAGGGEEMGADVENSNEPPPIPRLFTFHMVNSYGTSNSASESDCIKNDSKPLKFSRELVMR